MTKAKIEATIQPANEAIEKIPTDIVRLCTKLYYIMSELSFIAKDKTNNFHNYKYASEEAIKKAVHEQLVKHKVLFRMGIEEVYRHDVIDGVFNKSLGAKEEKKTFITNLRVRYYFTDVETGHYITDTFVGSGEDKGDKAIYKAITGAIKYVLTTVFLIPTGDDPESSDSKKETQQLKVGKITPNDKPIAPVVKEKPFISHTQLQKAFDRIVAGETALLDKIKLAYQLSEQDIQVLNEAVDNYLQSQEEGAI